MGESAIITRNCRQSVFTTRSLALVTQLGRTPAPRRLAVGETRELNLETGRRTRERWHSRLAPPMQRHLGKYVQRDVKADPSPNRAYRMGVISLHVLGTRRTFEGTKPLIAWMT